MEYYLILMSKIEELKQTYLKDAQATGSKPKFGFFSIPPSATAGYNAFEKPPVMKDQNGKVKTEQRNIFSGLTASGVLKKSFFKYEPSVFVGDPYMDPGKIQNKQNLEVSKQFEGKQVYKPLSLIKTPEVKAAYEHVPEPPKNKQVKDFVDENGKVKTEERNICSNSQSKIEKEKLKQFKYMPDPYENHLKVNRQDMMKSINLRGEAPFKYSSPVKDYFFTAREAYGQSDIPTASKKQSKLFQASAQHDGQFRPSCNIKYDTFSYPEYKPAGQKEVCKPAQKGETNVEAFRPVKQPNKFKPSPSITSMRSNIMRSIR